MISKRRDEITQSAAYKTYPFIIDISFCQVPPTMKVLSGKESCPDTCHATGHTWDEAVSRAKDGVLVARSAVPAGVGMQIFTHVMPVHPFHIGTGSSADHSTANFGGDKDLDQTFSFNHGGQNGCGEHCNHSM